MEWENHFRKMTDDIKEQSEEAKSKFDQEKTEITKTLSKYGPQIERVCSGFAKAVKWRYGSSDTWDTKTFTITHYDPKHEHDPYYHSEDVWEEFVVILYRDRMDTWAKGHEFYLTTPLYEFTEEGLAYTLEDYYRKIYHYL